MASRAPLTTRWSRQREGADDEIALRLSANVDMTSIVKYFQMLGGNVSL